MANVLVPTGVLAVSTWVGGLQTPVGVVVTALAMGATVPLDLPHRVARRARTWWDRRPHARPRTLHRAPLDPVRRLHADYWQSFQEGAALVVAGAVTLGMSPFFEAWGVPHGVVGVLSGLGIAMRGWGVFRCVGLPLSIVQGYGMTGWDLLPLSTGRTMRAIRAHQRGLLLLGLALDLATILVFSFLGVHTGLIRGAALACAFLLPALGAARIAWEFHPRFQRHSALILVATVVSFCGMVYGPLRHGSSLYWWAAPLATFAMFWLWMGAGCDRGRSIPHNAVP